MRVVIGLDVGGTKVAGGLVAAGGTVSAAERTTVTRSATGSDPGARATRQLVATLADAASAGGHHVVGLGIGVPEYVDRRGRIVSREVLAWPDPLDGRWLPTPVPTRIDSDVRCAARAELLLGAARAATDALYVTIGTGISHTWIVDGRVVSGTHGEAIAFGELRVDPDDVVLRDRPATVEAQASGRALEALGVDATNRDELALTVVGGIVGAAIARACLLGDPGLVVLGGGVGASGGAFLDGVRNRLAADHHGRHPPPAVVTASLATTGGILGAALPLL